MASSSSVVKTDIQIQLDENLEKEQEQLRQLLRLFPSFADLGDADFSFRQLHGGLTNKLYKVKTLPLKETVLIRMYGAGSELLIDREKENQMLEVLGDAGLAQPLLIEFKNGIVYRFTPGAPLDRFQCQTLTKEIAVEVAKWHSASITLPSLAEELTQSGDFLSRIEQELSTAGERSSVNSSLTASDSGIKQHAFLPHAGALWTNVQNWLHLAMKVPNTTGVTLDWERLKEEIKDLKRRVGTAKHTSQLVICHNDLLPGNIIHSKEEGKVSFIDLEYCAQNPAGFDIANHFAELGCDYDVLEMDSDPEKAVRRSFYRSYFDEMHRLGPGAEVDTSNDHVLEEIDEEIFLWKILAHIRWVLWAVIQSHHSKIEFDYGKFTRIRYAEYEGMLKSLPSH